MSKFIGYTVGLECWIDGAIKMVKVEYSEEHDGYVKLQAVSGHNLTSFGAHHSANIKREKFDNRELNDKTEQAIWALKAIGLTPAGLQGQ